MGLIVISPNAARGQAVNNAQIHGTVSDPTGAVVPNATIRATHVDTGKVQTTVTGTAGDYVLANLEVGAYSIEITAGGFERYVQKGIVLQVGDSVDLDVTLKVGATSQTVEVSAGASMVQTQDTSISEVIDQRRVDDLPLNGRLATQLVVMAGASTNYIPNGGDLTGSKNYFSSVSISVQGGEGNGVDYLLDGADHNDPFSNVNLPFPIPDALQEFSVQMNGLSARYGVHPGATANFVTKSGSNAMHGDLFEFVRNGQFNARLFGAPAEDTLRRNQFGGTGGGAIKKDKLFYFGAYQGTRLRTAPATTTIHIPTAAAMQGNFDTLESHTCVSAAPAGQYRQLWDPFAGGPALGTGTKSGVVYSATPPPVIPSGLFNSSALKLLALVPLSTDPCGAIGVGIPTPQDEDQILGRMDWTISSKQSFYGRYFDADFRQAPVYDPSGPLGLLTTTTYGNWERAQAMVLGYTWSISPTTINTAHLSWTRLRDTRGAAPNVPNNDDFGVINPNGSPLYQLVPHFINTSISSYFSVGCGTCAPGYFNRNTMQAADDLDFIHGKHQLVFGGEWIRHELNSPSAFDGNGVYTFNGSVTNDGLADLLLGVPSSFQQSMATAMNWRQDYLAAYAQDDYRVTPRLNVHAGVRWEPFLPEYDIFGRGSTFSLAGFAAGQQSSVYTAAPYGLLFVGDPNIPKGYAYNALDLFEPRIGFAWDMTGSGKQTLRGSYSIFYDLPETFYADRYANAFPWGGNNSLTPQTNGCTATAAGTLVGGCQPGFTSPYGWGATATTSPYPLPFPPPKTFNFGGLNSEGVYINFQLNSKVPSVQEWGLSLQRQFPHNWLFTASYLGTHTVHLWAGNEADPAVFSGSATTSTTSNTNQRRVLYLENKTVTVNGVTGNAGSYYSTIAQQFEGSYASYNALLLSATHRFSQNFSLLSNYTYSHCLSLSDFAGELTGPSFSNPNNPQADYGNCGMHLLHNFNTSIVASMPKFQGVWMNRLAGNWELSPIITAHSGPWYYTSLGSTDNSRTGVDADRPNVAGNPYQYSGNVATSNATTRYVQLLNPAAFSEAPVGSLGDEGRNSLLGPGFFNVDAALIRYFPVKEQMKFEFRIEAFNVFNRTNLVPPGWSVTAQTNLAGPGNANITSSTFPYTTQAFDMRILQLALKFYF
jgi:hypothetical protein